MGDGTLDAPVTNRRAEVRTPLDAAATLYCTRKIVRGRTRDISAGGVRLVVAPDAALSPGDTARVRITLPDQDVVVELEVLRRAQPPGSTEVELACRFLTIREEQRRGLRRLCQQMLSLAALETDDGSSAPTLRHVARSMAVRLERGGGR